MSFGTVIVQYLVPCAIVTVSYSSICYFLSNQPIPARHSDPKSTILFGNSEHYLSKEKMLRILIWHLCLEICFHSEKCSEINQNLTKSEHDISKFKTVLTSTGHRLEYRCLFPTFMYLR